MEFHAFRTEPNPFREWKMWVHVAAAGALGVYCLYGVFHFVDGFDLQGALFWTAYSLLGMGFLAIFAAVNMLLGLYFFLHLSNYGAAANRGITEVRPDGSVVLLSVKDGQEVARCPPGSTKSIVVGLDRFQQTASCVNRRENSEPVFVSLYCAEASDGESTWIDLFSIIHDSVDIIVSVNDTEIRFPYHGRPDYWKVAKRVALSCPAFANLEVHDASEK